MSQSKHTPGPWTFVGPSPGGTACDDGGDYAIIQGRGIIAEAIHHVDVGRTEDALANARLIAAAPDMLEALESVYERLHQDDTYVGDPLLAEVFAAIAKATGATPC